MVRQMLWWNWEKLSVPAGRTGDCNRIQTSIHFSVPVRRFRVSWCSMPPCTSAIHELCKAAGRFCEWPLQQLWRFHSWCPQSQRSTFVTPVKVSLLRLNPKSYVNVTVGLDRFIQKRKSWQFESFINQIPDRQTDRQKERKNKLQSFRDNDKYMQYIDKYNFTIPSAPFLLEELHQKYPFERTRHPCTPWTSPCSNVPSWPAWRLSSIPIFQIQQ